MQTIIRLNYEALDHLSEILVLPGHSVYILAESDGIKMRRFPEDRWSPAIPGATVELVDDGRPF